MSTLTDTSINTCLSASFRPGEAAYRPDDEDSPTDEWLLHCWAKENCKTCFDWWVERVYCDPRYLELRTRLSRKWRKMEIDERIADAVIIMSETNPKPEVRNAAGFFYTVVNRQAINVSNRERNSRVQFLDMNEAPEDVEQKSLVHHWKFSESTFTKTLASCREKLSQLIAEAIQLHYFDQLSVDEITSQLNIKPDCCYRRISRGRRDLVDCLKHNLDLSDRT